MWQMILTKLRHYPCASNKQLENTPLWKKKQTLNKCKIS